VISGSYSPGDIYFFRGLGEGEYAKRAKLRDRTGRPVNLGRASACSVADWDRDGDFDLIIGNIEGRVSWVPNEGAADHRPSFGKAEQLFQFKDGDAGPLVVDWDGDGLHDLLVGSGDGAIWLLLGQRDESGPKLRLEPQILKAPPQRAAGVEIALVRDEATGADVPDIDRSQMRSKPAACDWNGDGLLDLLVGDYVGVRGPEPKLTAEQVARRDRLGVEIGERSKALQALNQGILAQARRDTGVREEDRVVSEDLDRKVEARAKELRKSEEYVRLYRAHEEANKEWRSLWPSHDTHGYVWVYLRRPKAKTR